MLCTLADIDRYKNLKDGKNRLLGIDLGDKTVGLSLSDVTWTIASPYQTLKRLSDFQAITELEQIIHTFKVVVMVIGYPLNMNGSAGPQSEKVLKFVEKMLQRYDIPIFLWDERLSTMAVTRTLIEADVSRKKQKKAVDKMAASYILQGMLDSIRSFKV